MPEWITWSNVVGFISVLPGWVALWLALSRHFMEKTIIVFSLDWSSAEVDRTEEEYSFEADGIAYSEAVAVTVTNAGSRAVTIERIVCGYGMIRRDNSFKESSTSAIVHKRLAQGDAFTGRPKVPKSTSKIISIKALDSTGKEWLPKARQLSEFQDEIARRGLLYKSSN